MLYICPTPCSLLTRTYGIHISTYPGFLCVPAKLPKARTAVGASCISAMRLNQACKKNSAVPINMWNEGLSVCQTVREMTFKEQLYCSIKVNALYCC